MANQRLGFELGGGGEGGRLVHVSQHCQMLDMGDPNSFWQPYCRCIFVLLSGCHFLGWGGGVQHSKLYQAVCVWRGGGERRGGGLHAYEEDWEVRLCVQGRHPVMCLALDNKGVCEQAQALVGHPGGGGVQVDTQTCCYVMLSKPYMIVARHLVLIVLWLLPAAPCPVWVILSTRSSFLRPTCRFCKMILQDNTVCTCCGCCLQLSAQSGSGGEQGVHSRGLLANHPGQQHGTWP